MTILFQRLKNKYNEFMWSVDYPLEDLINKLCIKGQLTYFNTTFIIKE